MACHAAPGVLLQAVTPIELLLLLLQVLMADFPRKFRLDTSAVLHHRRLIEQYGGWRSQVCHICTEVGAGRGEAGVVKGSAAPQTTDRAVRWLTITGTPYMHRTERTEGCSWAVLPHRRLIEQYDGWRPQVLVGAGEGLWQ